MNESDIISVSDAVKIAKMVQGIAPDRLRELVEADMEGRLGLHENCNSE